MRTINKKATPNGVALTCILNLLKNQFPGLNQFSETLLPVYPNPKGRG